MPELKHGDVVLVGENHARLITWEGVVRNIDTTDPSQDEPVYFVADTGPVGRSGWYSADMLTRSA